ncbi:MAG TPA: DUF2961 domain-containing protein [Tepidisphaeraceae bacterium]
MVFRDASNWLIGFLFLLIALATGALASQPAATEPDAPQADNFLLDRLVRVPGQYQVLETSSHNPTAHNGDSGWPLYKDANGDDVIFDAAGPGCIRSIWGTAFSEKGTFKFCFDGEKKPRYTIGEIDFFSGKHPDFPPPLVSYDERGQFRGLRRAGNCFVPIPFAKSLKIAVANKATFYHVIYDLYPYGTPIHTFTGKEDRTTLLNSFARESRPPAMLPGVEIVKADSEQNAPDGQVVLFDRKDAGGIIREIVLEADGANALFQNTRLLMQWDGHERDDVVAPTGMFFGCATHSANVASLPVTVRKLEGGRVELHCYFPMPFWHSARIIWQNKSGQSLGPLHARIMVGPNDVQQDQGTYFTTLFHKGETTYRRDWPFFDSPGAGWFVGVVQSMYQDHYCEGNEHFYIDGAVSPQINGTGTEDYYLGCFWPNTIYSSPFAMSAVNILAEGGGKIEGAYATPTSYSRFHLEAPIPFFRSIDARIQHGGMSDVRSNYSSLAFCYLRARPDMRETDFIDVGNLTSEKMHEYAAEGSTLTGLITASPEGEYFETSEDQDGRQHTGGQITFTVAIDQKNAGVRLRRRLDQASLPQAADVYIDGQYAGRWTHTEQNSDLRWFDSDFDISQQFTRGKSALSVKLVVAAGPEFGPFCDFDYHVYCSMSPARPRGQESSSVVN